MEIEIIYPRAKSGSRYRKVLYGNLKWVIALGAAVSLIVNLLVGGPKWSYVVAVSCVILWGLLFPPTIQASVISRGCVITSEISVLLAVIDRYLAPGWAGFVIPIPLASALAALTVLYLSDRRRQSRNVMPLVLALTGSCAASALVILLYGANIPLIVLCCVSFSLLAASVATMRTRLISEAKKYFTTK